MSTILLLIIYIAFIGLGIPDSLFGTAWPAIYKELSIPMSFGSFVSIICSLGTVISSLFTAKLISKLGTNLLTAISTALAAFALLGFAFSQNMLMLCLFAIPLGFAAGAIDTALNNYVALHYSAMQMSFLHCAYGVGVTVSPFIMSRVIESSAGWRGGYRIAFIVQMIIAATVFATLAIWKKVKHSESGDGEEEEIKALNIVQTLKIPGVKAACCVFVTSCALEFICGVWGSTFLVEARGLNVAAAASIVMFYYLGMTVGRFLSGVLSARLSSWRIIFLGIVCLGVAIVILALPLPPYISAVGLFLVGLGNGPLFPNFQYLTPKTFGKSVSQSVIGAELAFSYIGIMVAPALFGVIGQAFTMELFPYALLLMYIGLVTSTVLTKKISSKKV